MYIEGIIERLNNPYLKQTNNQGRMVLDGTIGEYLEHYDNHILDMFIVSAKDEYLSLIGEFYGIIRQDEETDVELRQRILTEISIVDTTSAIKNLGIDLYTYDSDFIDEASDDESESWHLVSRNTLIRDLSLDYMFFGIGDDLQVEYVQDKFLNEDILWEDVV